MAGKGKKKRNGKDSTASGGSNGDKKKGDGKSKKKTGSGKSTKFQESTNLFKSFVGAIYRTISPNISSSSDSNFDDSFEQLCRPIKRKIIASSSQSEVCDSIMKFPTAENKIDEEELDRMFKNIDIREDSGDVIPIDWVEKSDASNSDVNTELATVYEGNETNDCPCKSVDSAMISSDSLDNSMKLTHTSKDSLEQFEITSKSSVPVGPNDTLEDAEYVHNEHEDRYLLKPVSKRLEIPSSPNSPIGSANFDSSVIMIDSSPDTSFATARYDLKLLQAEDIKSEISSDNSSDLSTKTLPWTKSSDSNRDISSLSIVSSSTGSFTTARNELKSHDHIESEILDTTSMETCISYPKTTSFYKPETDHSHLNKMRKSSEYYTASTSNQNNSLSSLASQLSASSPRQNTLDDVSSLMNDNSTVSNIHHLNPLLTDSVDSLKNFNDSLERIEYMMEQGRKIQEQSIVKTNTSPMKRIYNSSASHTTGSSTKIRILATPASQQRLPSNAKPETHGKSSKKLTYVSPASPAITPKTRILKPSNHLPVVKGQPERKYSPTISPAFKKPNFPTPVWKKEIGRSNAAMVSRIPKSKHFDHIVSPIGAYIKNIAAPPLLANVKPTTEFFVSSFCNKIPRELEYSIISDNGKESEPVSGLPMKFFSASHQQRIIDGKTQKIPGGEKLNRIIGQIPLVISHEGRMHSGSPAKRCETDESVADMSGFSVMSADVSVQVVRDVKRQ